MKHLITALTILASPAFAQEAMIAGNWTGLGHQSGDNWQMNVQFVPGAARVDYPDLYCGGVWVFASDGLPVTGSEWLTYGKQQCIDGLNVRIVAGADTLRITWHDPNGTQIAYADLKPEPARSGKKSN